MKKHKILNKTRNFKMYIYIYIKKNPNKIFRVLFQEIHVEDKQAKRVPC
jgi:hypothetical protein